MAEGPVARRSISSALRLVVLEKRPSKVWCARRTLGRSVSATTLANATVALVSKSPVEDEAAMDEALAPAEGAGGEPGVSAAAASLARAT
eukprot:5982598-Alexandrium_andersonii.AAC.1